MNGIEIGFSSKIENNTTNQMQQTTKWEKNNLQEMKTIEKAGICTHAHIFHKVIIYFIYERKQVIIENR